MSKPAVTDAMLVAACKSFYGDKWTFMEAEIMRDALLAAEDAGAEPPETVAVELNLEESGILCHRLMENDQFRHWVTSGNHPWRGSSYLTKEQELAVLQRWLTLYDKLADANDKLMGKEHD